MEKGEQEVVSLYLFRVIKVGLTELPVIFPERLIDVVLLLHLTEGGEPVWAPGHTHLRRRASHSNLLGVFLEQAGFNQPLPPITLNGVQVGPPPARSLA